MARAQRLRRSGAEPVGTEPADSRVRRRVRQRSSLPCAERRAAALRSARARHLPSLWPGHADVAESS